VQTRREITREATVREIKQTALDRMRHSGSTEVRFADIARDMRMSAPGLYRYFDGRDELLTALIADAFTDLAETVERARDAVPAGDVGARLVAAAQALRGWALAEPHRFALVFGPPVPGYVAPENGPTADANRRAMTALKSIVHEAHEAGVLRPPRHAADAPRFAAESAKHAEPADLDLPPGTGQAIMQAWPALYGFVALEAFGHLAWHGPAARGELFAGVLRTAADAIGLPAPHAGWPTRLG
jgi:AcrR family transcriptional regulator